MKRLITYLAALLISPLAQADERIVPPGSLTMSNAQRKATEIIADFLSNHHYKKTRLDDAVSSELLDRYIESLDPTRMYFLKSDIRAFEAYRYRLDDLLDSRLPDVTIAFEIFKRFRTRVERRTASVLQMLDTSFDFTKDETYVFDRAEVPWAGTEAQLDGVWRQRVKNDMLSQRLAGKERAESVELLTKRYQRVGRRVQQLDRNDVFQYFMNALGRTIEPHTAYMSPRSSENFRIRMSLSLEGIGAALQTENEYTVVRRIITGGPADLSKKLKVDDRIVGVAQGDEKMVDVVSWRLEDVVDLIRGRKGSKVRLEVKSKGAGAGAQPRIVNLVRDRVKLEEQAAKKSILTDIPGAPGTRVGVIDLPTFYLDIQGRYNNDPDYRSTTRDVRRLLGELEGEGVDGVVVDLRSNSGGSLIEATDLTGLFIDTGPVVQLRYSNDTVEVNEDSDAGVAYNGPLVVLVDRFSASASEIFAGAIQDYRRGVIIGEPTFGKGTVQRLLQLDRWARGQKGLGQLKMTTAQFFRVNGESTQHRGVTPDIVFPTAFDAADQGERALENAVPWSQTRPAAYDPSPDNSSLLARLIQEHKARVGADPGFQFLVAEATTRKSLREQKSVSLNENKRKAERDRLESEQLARENRFRVSRGLKPRDPDSDEEVEDLEGDILLEEAARIVRDMVDESAKLETAASG
ncbi:MAG: carboxy terminal-processing peptidase [Pseudomonadota bacterium]